MPDETNSPAPPEQMAELIAALHSLSGLEPLLRRLLEMESRPGVSDRIESFTAEVRAIRVQLERATAAVERALPAEARLTEITRHLQRQDARMEQMSADLQKLVRWLGLPPAEVAPRS